MEDEIYKKEQKLIKKGLQFIDSFEGYLYKKHPVTYEKYLDFKNKRDYHTSKILNNPNNVIDFCIKSYYFSRMGYNFNKYSHKGFDKYRHKGFDRDNINDDCDVVYKRFNKYCHKGFDRDNIIDVCDVVWVINEFYKIPNQSRLNFFDECEEFIVEQIEKSLD